ncbi:methyltransferase [Psychrosphaera sp. F3M07]|uniref:class I SAM-dependent methyltransferase n=2 Tax=Psychrosphaera TaxID=907197 RepID=UPI001C07FCF1|nr:methyltransferase [Psychrosphaera sp. F3M07]MBU2919399.1 methyltransferase [Psychrosphaera sp. F3M07]
MKTKILIKKLKSTGFRSFVSLAVFTSVLTATIPAYASSIAKAVQSDVRAEQSARDQYRHPQQTLEFFGLKPNMTVVEIWPGGGWYTSIINPIVQEHGKYFAANFHPYEGAPAYYQRSLDGFKQKVATNPVYKGIEVTEFHQTKALNIAPESSVDMVLTFRNVHNWYLGDGDIGVENAFKAFYKALKKGGVLGVVEHRMPESLDQVENKNSGYMKQSYVVAAAKKAGFKLVATSEINANPKDTAQHPRGVWTLPPSLRLGEEDKAKYLAIGESDRMTLKFVK